LNYHVIFSVINIVTIDDDVVVVVTSLVDAVVGVVDFDVVISAMYPGGFPIQAQPGLQHSVHFNSSVSGDSFPDKHSKLQIC